MLLLTYAETIPAVRSTISLSRDEVFGEVSDNGLSRSGSGERRSVLILVLQRSKLNELVTNGAAHRPPLFGLVGCNIGKALSVALWWGHFRSSICFSSSVTALRCRRQLSGLGPALGASLGGAPPIRRAGIAPRLVFQSVCIGISRLGVPGVSDANIATAIFSLIFTR